MNLFNKAGSLKGWEYPRNEGGRDLRIDFLRGVAMAMVVIAHIEIPSAYHFLTEERIGVVTAAEPFILLSGLIIGLIYPSRIARAGWKDSAIKLFKRSLQLYAVSLCVVIGVYLLRFIPGLNSNVLSTYTDASTQVVYDLYDNPGGNALAFIKNVLILRYGPGQFNIMGLYVVLIFAAPFILWMLEHKQTLLVVLLSGGLYLFNVVRPTRVTASQFENAFSLLAWQMLFILGMLMGYHWEKLSQITHGKYRRWLIILCITCFLVLMLYSLNNPWIALPANIRLTWINPDLFTRIYAAFFSRVRLGVGRAFNSWIVFIVAYALLTRYWKGINRAAGWFFIPIGQASLYVFVVHLFFVLLFDRIALFKQNGIWVNALGETLALLAIGFMVRRRFLFRLIPR